MENFKKEIDKNEEYRGENKRGKKENKENREKFISLGDARILLGESYRRKNKEWKLRSLEIFYRKCLKENPGILPDNPINFYGLRGYRDLFGIEEKKEKIKDSREVVGFEKAKVIAQEFYQEAFRKIALPS